MDVVQVDNSEDIFYFTQIVAAKSTFLDPKNHKSAWVSTMTFDVLNFDLII